MASYVSTRKRQTIRSRADSNQALRGHLQRLGLSSLDDYCHWCSEHGFPTRLDKSRHQLRQEVQSIGEARIRASLARKPKTCREIIASIFRGEKPPADTQGRKWSAVAGVYNSFRHNQGLLQKALRLLSHVADCEAFFRDDYAQPFGVANDYKEYLDGLTGLIRASRWWIRPVEDWKPRDRHPRQQFSSLARHLFARYPVPLFLDAVWFLNDDAEAERRQGWFRHLGQGENLRTAKLPIKYTSRMAHHFMQAPVHYRINDALRWGQILSLGGNARLVEAVCATRLGEEFTDDEFWLSVFRFFIAHPRMDLSHVGPIIDFLNDQRQPGFQVNRVGERVEVPAPNPRFSMKGRTPQSLIRLMEAWHRRLEEADHDDVEWAPTGLPGYEQVEGSGPAEALRKWTVTELLNSSELVAEGRAMHHCVASYINSCLDRLSSIWAIRLETPDGITSQVTIEVRPARKMIVQARGRYNSNPTGYQRLVMERWAKHAGLVQGYE